MGDYLHGARGPVRRRIVAKKRVVFALALIVACVDGALYSQIRGVPSLEYEAVGDPDRDEENFLNVEFVSGGAVRGGLSVETGQRALFLGFSDGGVRRFLVASGSVQGTYWRAVGAVNEDFWRYELDTLHNGWEVALDTLGGFMLRGSTHTFLFGVAYRRTDHLGIRDRIRRTEGYRYAIPTGDVSAMFEWTKVTGARRLQPVLTVSVDVLRPVPVVQFGIIKRWG